MIFSFALSARWTHAISRARCVCIDQDGQYFVVPADNESEGLPIALMMDDCYEHLIDRVTYVTKVWTYDDYQMRHFVQRLAVEGKDNDLYKSRILFSVFYTTQQGNSALLAVGRYQDRVRINGDLALFHGKRAILDTFMLPMNIVYPLVLCPVINLHKSCLHNQHLFRLRRDADANRTTQGGA